MSGVCRQGRAAEPQSDGLSQTLKTAEKEGRIRREEGEGREDEDGDIETDVMINVVERDYYVVAVLHA